MEARSKYSVQKKDGRPENETRKKETAGVKLVKRT